MVWQDEIAELALRKELAKKMGGEERVARQRRQGRLTIRERIDHLLDPGTFHEIGGLTGHGRYEDGKLVDFTPAPFVLGLGKIDGRTVCVGGEDFTISGGSEVTHMSRRKSWPDGFIEDLAAEYRLPLVLLLDGAGANVKTISALGHTYLPNSADWSPSVNLLSVVPVIGAVLGSCAGGSSVRAMLSHWTIMTKNTSDVFVAGPPVARRSIGEDITKGELGGSHVQVHISGVIDNEAENEDDAFLQIRRFLSYMPDSVWELPPYQPPTDDPNRCEEALLSIVPRERMRAFDMREIVELIVDRDSFFEIKPYHGQAVITGLARLNGHVVGVIANNPLYFGGALDGDAADKQTHFVDMCDLFHIPLVWLVDVPGLMVGSQSEQAGILRRGMRAFCATFQCTVPQVTVMVRRAYGAAGNATSNPARLNLRLAWPSGEWGSLPIEGGVDAAFRREIESAPDPAKRRQELEAEMIRMRSVFTTAEAFGVEDVIDPRETRPQLIRFIELAQRRLKEELGPKLKAAVRP